MFLPLYYWDLDWVQYFSVVDPSKWWHIHYDFITGPTNFTHIMGVNNNVIAMGTKSFGWILYKMMFIYDMDTVQTYLEKWEEMQISVMPLPKFWEKVRERRETWCDRKKKKFWIVAIPLSKLGDRKNFQLWQFSCQYMRAIVKRGIWKFGNHVVEI